MSDVLDLPRTRRNVHEISDEDWVRDDTAAGMRDEETLSAESLQTAVVPPVEQHPRLVVRGRVPMWVPPTIHQLNKLLSLPRNWDSYGARRIDLPRVRQAFRLLQYVMHDETPVPSIVPTSNGSLQLEWHIAGIDLEVLLLGDNSCNVVFEDRESGTEWEVLVLSDLSRLVEVVGELSRPRHMPGAGRHGQ